MASWPYNTATWQALRKAKLQAAPLCQSCARVGRVTVANTVDHVVSIASGGPAYPTLDGLASMCAPCHNTKTNAADRPERAASAGLYRGCGPGGLPLDPDHPFVAGEGNPLGGRGTVRSKTGGPSKTQLVSRNRSGYRWD